MIRANGQPCLIDFGSARQAIAERSQVMSAIVKTGYSPPEQYTTSGKAQGAWSDIYALGATLYRALTGNPPPEATERQIDDELKPIAQAVPSSANYRSSFLAGIDAALRLKVGERPQSVAAWQETLFGAAPTPIDLQTRPALKNIKVREATFSTLVSKLGPAMPGLRQARTIQIGGAFVALGLLLMGSNAVGIWSTAAQHDARRVSEEKIKSETEATRLPSSKVVDDRQRAAAEAQRATNIAAARWKADADAAAKARVEEERQRLASAQIEEDRRRLADVLKRAQEERQREDEIKRQRLTDAANAAPRYSYVWDTRPPDDWLALRTEPSARSGRQLARMANGTLIEVLEKRPDNWWRVRVVETGLEGWTLNRQGDRVWIYCCRAR